MRTAQNELMFSVNGEAQGIAATNIPKPCWAVVSLYGKCTQISICIDELPMVVGPTAIPSTSTAPISAITYDIDHFVPNFQEPISITTDTPMTTLISGRRTETFTSNGMLQATIRRIFVYQKRFYFVLSIFVRFSGQTIDCSTLEERLHFHIRCGSLVILTANNRTAERRRPLDEFNNGVVMTHRSLRDNELFEIRIDKLVDKWSGSIEVGVTTHNPNSLHFPATMTNMRSGTIMMSGCGILTNGKGTRREYGEFNLDELREGDRVGMMRKSNGNLHYYINGQDQGVAAKQGIHCILFVYLSDW